MLHTRFLVSSIIIDKYIKRYGWAWARFLVEKLIRYFRPGLGTDLNNIHIGITRPFFRHFLVENVILDNDRKNLIEMIGD